MTTSSIVRALLLSTMACMHASLPAAERVRRGVADPVYLYFSSFVQLAIHRMCGQLLGAALTGRPGGSSNSDAVADRYGVLVRREAERRGVSKDVVETFSPYRLHHFSEAQFDAAHRSVVNAKSRARTTNEEEYSRLRQRALDK